MPQKYTSATTSINKNNLPAIYNKIDWPKLLRYYVSEIARPVILDVGAGRYTEHIKKFCNDRGFKYYAYDKYNGSTNGWDGVTPNFVICSNVLNVIDDNEDMEKLHKWIINRQAPYAITVYEGDGSGIGKETKKDCYQRNEKIGSYKIDDELVFKGVLTKIDYVWCLK